MQQFLNTHRYAILAVGFIIFQGLILWAMGQPTISASGKISLWAGEILSPDNSQQISDWYTFSHIIHGFLFYWFATMLFPRSPVSFRLLLAMGVEIGWEVLENTPWVINHYREQALAVGYTGDSILNSLCDTVSMILGFFFAWRYPITLTIAIGIFFELFVAYEVRDNLTLNVINLLYQFDFIHTWQSGG